MTYKKIAAILMQVNGLHCSTKRPFACLFQQVTPSCPAAPGGCFPGASPAPILHTWLKTKRTGDIKPRETTAPGAPLPPVLHQEDEGGLPATADWALLHPVSLPLVPYTCFSSLEEPQKEQRGQTFFSLQAPAPLSMAHGRLWDIRWLARSCPIISIHQSRGSCTSLTPYILNIFHPSGRQTRIFGSQWGKRIGGTARRSAVALGWKKFQDYPLKTLKKAQL